MQNKKYIDADIISYTTSKNDMEYVLDLLNNDLSQNYRKSWEYCSLDNKMHNPFLKNKIFYQVGLEVFTPLKEFALNYAINADVENQKKRMIIKNRLDKQAMPNIIDYVKEFGSKIETRDQWCIIKNDSSLDSDFFIDFNQNNKTVISCIFALNDNYDGGEFLFENRNGNEKYKLPAGNLLLYPSQYKHKLCPVISGTQYLAVSFGLNPNN